jgi:mRNA deadenylase 3'-5' endonuclease subunit Ccr4
MTDPGFSVLTFNVLAQSFALKNYVYAKWKYMDFAYRSALNLLFIESAATDVVCL